MQRSLYGLLDQVQIPGMSADDDVQKCIDQGNSVSKPIDDRAYALAQSWNPSDYYEPAALRQAVASVQAVLSSAFDALAQANDACNKAPGCRFPTYGDSYGGLLEATNKSKDYLAACDAADTSASAALKTAYVYAPGFKKWVTEQAFYAASFAMTNAAVIGCLMPWWAEVAVAVVNAVNAAADVLASILGVGADVVNAAYQTGKAVVQVAQESFNFVAWVVHYFPFLVGGAALFFGGRYIWKHREALKARIQRKLPGR